MIVDSHAIHLRSGDQYSFRAFQELVYMQQNPPFASSLSNETLALEYTFYQWGFTPWAMYGLFALIIGHYL